jgi:hypothetical protein
MRRVRISYAAMACAGAAASIAHVGLTSCVGANNPLGTIQSPDGAPPGGEDSGADATIGNTDGAAGDSAAGGDALATTDSGSIGVGDGGNAGQGTPDGGSDATAPCAPGSVAAFTAPPYVHSNGSQWYGPTNCEANPLVALAISCAVDDSTFEACSSYPLEAMFWGTAAQCTACLLTPEVTLSNDDAGALDAGDDADAAPPTYGAAVVTRVTVPNVAGCIEQTDPTDTGLSCATAVQAAWRCEEFACNPTCPVTDDPSEAAYFACTQAAAATVCKSYADPAAACLAVEADAGGNAYATCLATTLKTYDSDNSSVGDQLDGSAVQFFNIAQFFCNS